MRVNNLDYRCTLDWPTALYAHTRPQDTDVYYACRTEKWALAALARNGPKPRLRPPRPGNTHLRTPELPTDGTLGKQSRCGARGKTHSLRIACLTSSTSVSPFKEKQPTEQRQRPNLLRPRGCDGYHAEEVQTHDGAEEVGERRQSRCRVDRSSKASQEPLHSLGPPPSGEDAGACSRTC